MRLLRAKGLVGRRVKLTTKSGQPVIGRLRDVNLHPHYVIVDDHERTHMLSEAVTEKLEEA